MYSSDTVAVMEETNSAAVDEAILLLRKADPVSRFSPDIPTLQEIEDDYNRIFGKKSEAEE